MHQRLNLKTQVWGGYLTFEVKISLKNNFGIKEIEIGFDTIFWWNFDNAYV